MATVKYFFSDVAGDNLVGALVYPTSTSTGTLSLSQAYVDSLPGSTFTVVLSPILATTATFTFYPINFNLQNGFYTVWIFYNPLIAFAGYKVNINGGTSLLERSGTALYGASAGGLLLDNSTKGLNNLALLNNLFLLQGQTKKSNSKIILWSIIIGLCVLAISYAIYYFVKHKKPKVY